MVRLELPSAKYRNSFLDALLEYQLEGETPDPSLFTKAGFPAYLHRLEAESEGRGLKEGYVPATEFWIIDDDGYAGRISLRHSLNDYLTLIGGHIGYQIRPRKRKRGYATQALELVLVEARRIGLESVLITCDSENSASRKVIERNSGTQEPFAEGEDTRICRYWIQLKESPTPEFAEEFRISGIEVKLTAKGEVWCGGRFLGKVAREQRFDQWFWRAYDADPEVEIKRFFTSRPEAIQLLLLRADLIEGIGF